MQPGVSLRSEERSLAERLLAQSAVALGNLRLETELAAKVAELDQQTAALAASRQQIVEAGDEAKARFSLALSERVLPHLNPLPERLAALGRRCQDGDRRLDLHPEHDATTAALEELRRLVHGMAPDVRQRAAVSQAAVSRSGPNADLVT
jgi:multidrug efflux pump subunit AcrA (membrane-fusion protein)